MSFLADKTSQFKVILGVTVPSICQVTHGSLTCLACLPGVLTAVPERASKKWSSPVSHMHKHFRDIYIKEVAPKSLPPLAWIIHPLPFPQFTKVSDKFLMAC